VKTVVIMKYYYFHSFGGLTQIRKKNTFVNYNMENTVKMDK